MREGEREGGRAEKDKTSSGERERARFISGVHLD